MEQNTSLFGLAIDAETKTTLYETAKWARFLSIVGFILVGFIVIVAIFFSVSLSRLGADDSTGIMAAAGIGGALMYLIAAAVMFFPFLFMFRFASHMRDALNSNDQGMLNSSFQNLKACYRFWGIITIIYLVIMALATIFVVLGSALS